MSEFNWKAVIEQIKNGEPVDEAVANRALVALAERTDWLKTRLEQLDTTSGKLTLSSAAVDTTVAGGDWVYYDTESDTYKPALAGLDWDDTLKTYLPTPRSLVAGIVVDKISPTLAVILVVGEGVNLPEEPDIANMQSLMQDGEDFIPGRCFLSHTTPGKMTRFPAGAPLVPLGVFDTESSTVRPEVRDAFDSHYHRRFELHAKPAASNNFGTDGVSVTGGKIYVDHYYKPDGSQSVIGLAHRRNATKVPNPEQRRVDIKKGSTGKLTITLHQDVDPANPVSVAPAPISKTINMPAYGQEIVVDWPADGLETDLIFAFIRVDWTNAGRYANSLQADLEGGLATTDTNGTWKVNVPDDYKGWGNANPFRSEVPALARFRYITEGHYDLFDAFPPIPAEGAILYRDGAVANSGVQYLFSYFDLFWMTNGYTGTNSADYPWPWDYVWNTGSGSETKDLQLTFVQNPLGPTESIVKCLTSVSNLLEITQLGGTQGASTGALQIALKLALAIKNSPPIIAETVLAGIDSQSRFILGKSVSELVAGANTKLVKINSDGSENTVGPFIGKVRVEAVLPTLQGDSTGIALFNAKESEKNGVIYTEFLQPSKAKTAIAARIKIPNIEVGVGQSMRLRLYAMFMGEVTSVGITQGIFKVEYRIANLGKNLSSGLAAPARVEAWKVPFTNAYVPFKILDFELPVYGPTGGETFTKEPASSIYNLYKDDLLLPNDIISVKMERVSNSSPFQVGDSGSLSANTLGADDYPGNIGLVGLRWTIDIT